MHGRRRGRLLNPLVLLHGFTQTARSWDRFAELLRASLPGRPIVALDAPGHGDRSDVVADLETGADQLGEAGGPGVYVGYSMGGRYALHLALRRPDLVRGLVLIGATPGIEDDAERAARRAADEQLADELESMGVEAFLERWLAQPLFAGLTAEAAGVEARLANTAPGLASSLRHAGTGTQRSLWSRLGDLTAPTLVVVGADDAKFEAIGHRMVEAMPSARLTAIDGAGHSTHLERPEATAAAIAEWLGRAGI